MKYYRDNKNNVYAYEIDGSQDCLIGDKVAMTSEEIELHLNPIKTQEQLQAEANAEALAYLASTDWYIVRKTETGVDVPSDVLAKRQEARESIK